MSDAPAGQTSPSQSMRRWLRRDLPLLMLVLVGGGALRVARLDFDGLTFDELWHLELSTGRGSPHLRIEPDTLVLDAPAVTSLRGAPPVWAIWTRMERVLHPPLYCIVLRLWRDAFGEGDTPARMFSIVCSLVAIALLYEVARRLHGRRVAAWAALLLAVAPAQVWLAQQVRGYALLGVFAMAGLLALVCLEQGVARRAARLGLTIGFGACLLAMVLTHYFAIGACAAMGVYALLRLRGQVRRGALLAAVVAAVVFLACWGPFFARQTSDIAETADTWLVEHVSDHHRLTATRALIAPWRLFADAVGPSLLPLLGGLVFVVPVALLLAAGRSDLLIWCLWLGGTIGLLVVLDLSRSTMHLVYPRYFSLATPAVFALAVASVPERWHAWIRHGLPAAAAVAGLALAGTAYTSEEPDWRALAALDARLAPGEAVLFASGDKVDWYNSAYYLACAHYSRGFPRPVVVLSGERVSAALIAGLPGRRAWIVSGLVPTPISDFLPGCRTIHQDVLDDMTLITGVVLPDRD